MQPDAALAAVVGKDPLPRTELTKKLWEYICKHELQDPKEKRNIRADERLLAVFDGKKVVSMLEMTKLVKRAPYLIEVRLGSWEQRNVTQSSGLRSIVPNPPHRDFQEIG